MMVALLLRAAAARLPSGAAVGRVHRRQWTGRSRTAGAAVATVTVVGWAVPLHRTVGAATLIASCMSMPHAASYAVLAPPHEPVLFARARSHGVRTAIVNDHNGDGDGGGVTYTELVRDAAAVASVLYTHYPKLAMLRRVASATAATPVRSADDGDGIVGDGNVRLDSAGRLKYVDVPVVFMMPYNYQYVRTLLGVWAAGGVAVPLSPGAKPAEIEHVLQNAFRAAPNAPLRDRPLLCHSSLADVVAPLVETHGVDVIMLDEEVHVNGDDGGDGGGGGVGGGSVHDSRTDDGAMAQHNTITDIDGGDAFRALPGEESGALIIYTSGTSGTPKGVLHTHASLRAQIESLVHTWRWQPTDRALNVLPLNHIHGIVNVLLCALWSGAALEMHTAFDAARVYDRLAAGEPPVTFFSAVPTVYVRMIAHHRQLAAVAVAAGEAATTTTDTAAAASPLSLNEGFSRLRLMISGSAALPGTVYRSWLAISGHRLLERYGMSELGMALSNVYEPQSARIEGSVGATLPFVQCRLGRGGDGDGADGELLVRSPQMFACYWDQPGTTAAAFTRDGWFMTGDAAEFTAAPHGDGDEDEDDNGTGGNFGALLASGGEPREAVANGAGTYRILGRLSMDILKRGGYKLSCLEIERALLESDTVEEVCVFGVKAKDFYAKYGDDDGGGGGGGDRGRAEDEDDDVVLALLVPPPAVRARFAKELRQIAAVARREVANEQDVVKTMHRQQQLHRSTRDRLTVAAMQRHARARMSAYKVPQRWAVVDTLPRNQLGKINKKSLAEQSMSVISEWLV